jgi:hypothetical protein
MAIFDLEFRLGPREKISWRFPPSQQIPPGREAGQLKKNVLA